MNYIDRWAGEIAAELDPALLPDEDVGALMRLYAVLLLAKGDVVTASDVHDAWSAWMAAINPGHASLVPFEELLAHDQRQDDVFVAAIRTVASRR